ncbi:hypothetical protein [Streptomyces venetus]|uniref:hypothetical protein n=1 Tax=Streptomyces venetus TaxID=1701086 RepID=UPI003C3022DC
MSAHQAVVSRLRTVTDDAVLIIGGAGGVGGFAVQLAALAGARVITTAQAHDTTPTPRRWEPTRSSTTGPRMFPHARRN